MQNPADKAARGELGTERSLKALGMPEHGIESAADIAVRQPYPNPAKLDYDRIRDMLAAAWSGETERRPG